jgi:small multidrug resistance pump
VKDIPVGLAYATWSGTGILVVSTLNGIYGQHPDTAAIIGMAVIASGIVIMNLFSKMGSEESEDTPAKPVASPSSGQKSRQLTKRNMFNLGFYGWRCLSAPKSPVPR